MNTVGKKIRCRDEEKTGKEIRKEEGDQEQKERKEKRIQTKKKRRNNGDGERR